MALLTMDAESIILAVHQVVSLLPTVLANGIVATMSLGMTILLTLKASSGVGDVKFDWAFAVATADLVGNVGCIKCEDKCVGSCWI